jgi:hypothetical protein
LRKVGNVVELLGDGDLQMVAGKAFVVGDHLHAVKVAVGGVVGVDEQPSRAAAIGRAGLVISGRGGLLKVVRNRNHFEGSLGQAAEELRQLGLHRRQVAAVGCQQRLARGWMQLGIGLEAGAEALQVSKAELLRNDQHLGLVALHLVQADLVNLLRGQVRGGARRMRNW